MGFRELLSGGSQPRARKVLTSAPQRVGEQDPLGFFSYEPLYLAVPRYGRSKVPS